MPLQSLDILTPSASKNMHRANVMEKNASYTSYEHWTSQGNLDKKLREVQIWSSVEDRSLPPEVLQPAFSLLRTCISALLPLPSVPLGVLPEPAASAQPILLGHSSFPGLSSSASAAAKTTGTHAGPVMWFSENHRFLHPNVQAKCQICLLFTHTNICMLLSHISVKKIWDYEQMKGLQNDWFVIQFF